VRPYLKSRILLCAILISSLAFAGEKKPFPPAILNAKTVMVIGRVGNVGGGKESPNAKRAKSEAEKELQKWGRYQIVDSLDKADLVFIITEGHVAVYGSSRGDAVSPGRMGTDSVDRPNVLSDTLAVYDGHNFDENSDPLWKETETTDDYPSQKVIKKLHKDVDKAGPK